MTYMDLREQIAQEITRLERELTLAREHLARIDGKVPFNQPAKEIEMEERSLWTSSGFKKFMMPKVA